MITRQYPLDAQLVRRWRESITTSETGHRTGFWRLCRRAGKRILLVGACCFMSGPSIADCSLLDKIGCAFVEAGCVPAALGGRDPYLECISKTTGHGCDACIGIGGSPGNPICWDGSTTQVSGGCGSGSQPSASGTFGLTIPIGYAAQTLVANQDGHLEFFGQTNGGLTHYWQENPSGDWQTLGSQFPSSPTSAQAPFAIRHLDGRLEVFVVATDGSVHRISQVAPNVNWGDWKALPGVTAISAPSATVNLLGETSVVVLAANHEVFLTTNRNSDGAMTHWRSLGGSLSAGPVIALNADGRREIFAVGTDGALWHVWEVSLGGGWSPWATFGGSFVGTPTVAMNADGRLEVFATTEMGVLRHVWQVRPSADWSAWSDFPGTHKFSVSVFPNANRMLAVYAVGVQDGAVYYSMQSVSTGSWTDWKTLGGKLQSAPRVAVNTDGTLEIVAVGQDYGIWHLRQQTENSLEWSGWQKIASDTFSSSF